jgi:hypothetical protein
MYRVLSLFLVALAVVAFVSLPVVADDKNKDDKTAGGKNMHEGTFVSATGNTLVMKGKGAESKEHRHTIAKNARIMCDGKECALTDLKPGQKIRVTVAKDATSGTEQVTKLEALDKEKSFPRTGTNPK